MGKSPLWTVLVLCALCGEAPGAPAGAPETYSADSIKAAFVFRFAGYITWPPESLPAGRFDIAVLGADEIAENLQALLVQRSLLNQPVQVRRITSIREAAGAQILYVGRNHRGDLRALLSTLASRNMLVITSEDAGLASGSTINLLIVEQRVRFEISLAAARRAGLRISSDLLALAVRVQE